MSQKALTCSQVYIKDGLVLATVDTLNVDFTAAEPFRVGVSRILGLQYYLNGAPTVPIDPAAADLWYVKSVADQAAAGSASAPRVVVQSDTAGAANLRARMFYVNESLSSSDADKLYAC